MQERPGAECPAPTNVGASEGRDGSLRACAQWAVRAFALPAERGAGIPGDSCTFV